VSALLAASATAFAALKWLGAAYLLWIGFRLLLARERAETPDLQALAEAQPPVPLRAVFLGGFWTNVLNPKVAIFFLAFVPQFIAPDSSDKAGAFLLLGSLFIANSVPVNSGWALAAAWMARREAVQRGMRWLDRIAGAMFVAFGLRLALADNPTT
jgi:threonine/homoserine/homoserine lactone efflux protein